MEDTSPKRSAQQLLALALGQEQGAEPGDDAAQTDEPTIEPSAEVEEAIELYFAAEEPLERDAAFAALCRLNSPEVAALFAAMMAHDEDPFLRVAAAAQLARRGFEDARAYLAQTVAHSSDDQVFEHALAGLVAYGGPAMLAPLTTLWRDEQRERTERLAAMQAMEQVDPQGALVAWLAELKATPSMQELDLEALGIALTGLVRHADPQAEPVMRALRERAISEPFADALDREALLSILDEGLAVLAAGREA